MPSARVIHEVRTFVSGPYQLMEYTPLPYLEEPVQYRAQISAAGAVNGQQLQVSRVVTLQATSLDAAFDELERDQEMHAQHAFRAAVEQMQAQNRKLIIPGSEPLNGRMRLQK